MSRGAHSSAAQLPPRVRWNRPVATVAAAVVLAILLVVALLNRHGSGASDVSTNKKSGYPQAGGRAGTDAGTPTAGSSTATAPGRTAVVTNPPGTALPGLGNSPVPLKVAVSNTTDLKDGDTVPIHVTADKGSSIYGFEAFLCSSTASYRVDADVRPTETGKCADRPLSADSQRYLLVQAQAPYTTADGTFTVGTGADSYTTSSGRSVTLVCGAGHPCDLVLKLQYPNGYGFQAVPLSFR